MIENLDLDQKNEYTCMKPNCETMAETDKYKGGPQSWSQELCKYGKHVSQRTDETGKKLLEWNDPNNSLTGSKLAAYPCHGPGWNDLGKFRCVSFLLSNGRFSLRVDFRVHLKPNFCGE